MTNTVAFRSTFDDRVSSGLDRLRDRFDQLGKSKGAQSILGGVGLGVGVAAFNALDNVIGGVTDTIYNLTREAAAEQVGIERLSASLKANITNWDGNTDAIEQLIAKREDLAFSDDALRESLSLLAGATHDVTQALAIQQTAMDLARFKGISLQEASEALTKVEAGSYRVLKSLGIVLRDGATQTEALAAVQKVAAGQAEAYAKTTAGAFERAQIKMQDAREEIGKQLLPVLADLATTFVDDVIPAAQDFVATIADVLSPIARVNDLLKEQGGILGTVGKAWEFITGPLKATGDAMFEIGYQMDLATGKTRSAEDSMRHAVITLGVSVDELNAKFEQAQGAVTAWAREGEGAAAAMSRAFSDARPAIEAAATDDARILGNQIVAERERVRKEAYEDALAAASGLIAGQRDVESGAAALTEALKHELSGARRIALLEGQLAGEQMQRGLHSKDPLVRAAAITWKNDIEAQLDALRKDAATSGATIGAAWISGIGRGIASHYNIVKHQLEKVESDLRGKSPPKTGPLAGLSGEPIGAYWSETLAAGLAKAQGLARQALGGLSLTAGGGLSAGPSFAGAGAGGGTIIVKGGDVYLDGARVGRMLDREQYFDISRASPSAVRK